MKSTFHAELLVRLDRTVDIPLRQQIERAIRSGVQTGRLAGAQFLPSTRTMATALGVGRGVVVEAYEQLVAEGYLVTQSGSGTRIADVGTSSHLEEPPPTPARWWPRYDFRPGMPDLDSFPRREWLGSFKKALLEAPRESLGYPDPAGPRWTRHELASFLARSRATVGDADRLVLCNGFTQGIGLVAGLLKANGVKCVGIEDPGFDGVVKLFQSFDITPVRVPVDEKGLVVEKLSRSLATAVVVTPAHQFPTGVGMAPDRRADLIRWALAKNAVIVEDDYDAEFRYDREPIGSLQGLAPGHVIYIGTTSKTLSPALRLGWILSPAEHVPALSRLRRRADRGSATLDQLALGHFLQAGHMDRHLKGMRPIYRGRRDALLAALRKHLPTSKVQGLAAGLHVLMMLPDGTDERTLVAAAAEESIRVFGARPYWARPDRSSPALVMGYGGLDKAVIQEGVRKLADLLKALR